MPFLDCASPATVLVVVCAPRAVGRSAGLVVAVSAVCEVLQLPRASSAARANEPLSGEKTDFMGVKAYVDREEFNPYSTALTRLRVLP
jgi:hypothetical protein